METTGVEKAIIDEVIKKKAENQRKWAYPLCALIKQKRELNKALRYIDIVEWLSVEGLPMSLNSLRKLMFDYKRRMMIVAKTQKDSLFTNNTILPSMKHQLDPKEPEINEETNSINLDELLRQRVQQAKMKGAGFEAFKDL